jgi:hypothetical protein
VNKKILAFILLLVAIVSCSSPKPEPTVKATDFPTVSPTQAVVEMLAIGDGGLFSGQPCASPCFFGIRIGETLSEQVIPTLRRYDIFPCTYNGERIIGCGAGSNAVAWVTIERSTSIVDGIGYYPNSSIAVENIIIKYGNPNHVRVWLDDIGEELILYTSLLWNSTRMEVDLRTAPNDEWRYFVIEKSTEVGWIWFMGEINYSELSTNEYSQPWNGYGIYKP